MKRNKIEIRKEIALSGVRQFRHAEREFHARVMEEDEVWTTLMLYSIQDGELKADKPLTVKTKSLEEI